MKTMANLSLTIVLFLLILCLSPIVTWLEPEEFLILILLFIAIFTGILIFGLNGNNQSVWAAHNRPVSKITGLEVKNLSQGQGVNQEKRRLRQKLLNGEIRVDNYRQLLAEIKEKSRK